MAVSSLAVCGRGGEYLPIVRVEPLGIELTVLDDETLIEAAWRQGFFWPTICKGNGRCTQCYVEVIEGLGNLGEPERDEQVTMDILLGTILDRAPGRIRLACRVRPVGSAVVLKPGVRFVGPEPSSDAE